MINEVHDVNGVTIGVIGGGAAGMMAAITAARLGANVTILESGDRLGQKILSTGNGKCNLGNLLLDAGQYHGSCQFLSESLKTFGTKETMAFFEGLGLLLREKNGYLYPLCEQASAVLDVLRHEVAALGISVQYDRRVTGIQAGAKRSWRVQGSAWEMEFDRVILSCGGRAMPKTGSDGSGYDLAKKLGHRVVAVVPALTQLKCRETFFKGIAGVRTEAEITLSCMQGEEAIKERGELQLTDSGISGIPVFQLSRYAGYALERKTEIPVSIDFLPGFSQKDLEEMAEKRMPIRLNRTVEEFFTGLLHKKLMGLLVKQSGLKGTDPAGALSKKEVLDVLHRAKDFRVSVIGTGNFQNCQVCAGGVDAGELSPAMESKLCKGIFFAGELVDVDGRCGGYNLQWAWTSGYLAGKWAAEGRE